MITFPDDEFAEFWDKLVPRLDDVVRKHFQPLRRTLDMIGRGIAQLHFRLDDLQRRLNEDHEAGRE